MNYEHSIVVNKTRCPKCAQLGMDTRGDNLVNYSDGHSFCYSCGYLNNPLSTRLSNLTLTDSILESVAQQPVKLPPDIGIDYPQKVIDWIGSYELTITDLYNHNFLWSNKGIFTKSHGQVSDLLIYPVWQGESVAFWTGRYFGNDPNIPKWLNKGSPKDIVHCINRNAKVIVITEDIISGIKILNTSKDYGVLVLFNSHNPINKLLSLGKHSYRLWLDNDKSRESLLFTKESKSIGLDVTPVFSQRDPKDESYFTIRNLLND